MGNTGDTTVRLALVLFRRFFFCCSLFFRFSLAIFGQHPPRIIVEILFTSGAANIVGLALVTDPNRPYATGHDALDKVRSLAEVAARPRGACRNGEGRPTFRG
jgi:hypothetical protein